MKIPNGVLVFSRINLMFVPYFKIELRNSTKMRIDICTELCAFWKKEDLHNVLFSYLFKCSVVIKMLRLCIMKSYHFSDHFFLCQTNIFEKNIKPTTMKLLKNATARSFKKIQKLTKNVIFYCLQILRLNQATSYKLMKVFQANVFSSLSISIPIFIF